MYLTGFADEAATDIDGQIEATKELGWKNIESRVIDGINLTDIPEDKFKIVCDKLSNAGVKVNCFGSAIGNWAKKLSESPQSSYDEMKRAVPRMQKLGTKLIRIMSFAIPDPLPLTNKEAEKEAIKRIKEIVKIAEDGGVICVHENCACWGGQSYEHTLRLLDAIPSKSLKLVFDTGNPVFDLDIRGNSPYKYQNSLEFYRKVKKHIVYIHIKDGKMIDGKMQYMFAGEGDGSVVEILTDLMKNGYDGGISIEPHLKVVVHDSSVKSDAKAMYDSYIEYGRRTEKILSEIGWNIHHSRH
ncbi:MAG: sugar phosphate isomerase/epimerase [Elusimicrobia bacterium]|nr:sugar phosphate isomerase/epimerase [Elusimicrobiota bacterium]